MTAVSFPVVVLLEEDVVVLLVGLLVAEVVLLVGLVVRLVVRLVVLVEEPLPTRR